MFCFTFVIYLFSFFFTSNAMANSWPLELAPPNAWPEFEDNLSFERMDLAIDRQLNIMEAKTVDVKVEVDGRIVNTQEIIQGLKNFKKLSVATRKCRLSSQNTSASSACIIQFNQDVRSQFDLYRPKLTQDDSGFGKDNYTRFTGYYSPELAASRELGEEFVYPVYAQPKDKALKSKTRDEIDFQGAFVGQDLELGYGNNLFDLYMLQVQGGGALRFTNEDGSTTLQYLSYAGGNGQSFSFLYQYMIKMKYIKSGSIKAQRNFITNNPDKQREIFSVCPNYIYFKFTDHGPVGVDNIILTDGRSIAQDIGRYRVKGLISYISASLPTPSEEGKIVNRPFNRFFIDQDTGGAIKGKARADIYFGFGKDAELRANNTNHMGRITYLIPKVKNDQSTAEN